MNRFGNSWPPPRPDYGHSPHRGRRAGVVAIVSTVVASALLLAVGIAALALAVLFLRWAVLR